MTREVKTQVRNTHGKASSLCGEIPSIRRLLAARDGSSSQNRRGGVQEEEREKGCRELLPDDVTGCRVRMAGACCWCRCQSYCSQDVSYRYPGNSGRRPPTVQHVPDRNDDR